MDNRQEKIDTFFINELKTEIAVIKNATYFTELGIDSSI